MMWALIVLGIVNAAAIFVLGFKLDAIYSTVTTLDRRTYAMQTDVNQLQEVIEPFLNSDAEEEFPDEAYTHKAKVAYGPLIPQF